MLQQVPVIPSPAKGRVVFCGIKWVVVEFTVRSAYTQKSCLLVLRILGNGDPRVQHQTATNPRKSKERREKAKLNHTGMHGSGALHFGIVTAHLLPTIIHLTFIIQEVTLNTKFIYKCTITIKRKIHTQIIHQKNACSFWNEQMKIITKTQNHSSVKWLYKIDTQKHET